MIGRSIKPLFLGFALLFVCSFSVMAANKGIYISQATAENPGRISSLIKQSKAVGINTFVVDLTRAGPTYANNIRRIKDSGLKFVARIVIFPNGANRAQMHNKAIWEQRWTLVKKAIDLGADEIQLDYIRYNTKQRPLNQNAQDVLKVIQFFKKRVAKYDVPLQIDVFGETLHYPSKRIGQNLKVFAGHVDTICPMTYPSHYEPFRQHAKTPYRTVNNSLTALKQQFGNKVPFNVITYIELYNYRYKLSRSERINYINAQIKAVKDSGFDGWYAWSPNNQYSILFEALREKQRINAAR